MKLRCYYLLAHLLAHLPVVALVLAPSASVFAQEESAFAVYTGPRSLDRVRNTPIGSTPIDPTAQFSAALFNEAGLEYSLTVVPWSRAVQSVRNEANVMVYSMIRSEQREDLYEWIGLITPIETFLYAMRGELANVPATLEEARNYRIGLSRSSASAELLSDLGFDNLLYTGDPARAPVMLERGRIDLVPMTLDEAMGAARDHGLEADALIPAVRLDELSTGTYYVVSKQTDPELVARLKSAYQRLVDDGTHARIFSSFTVMD